MRQIHQEVYDLLISEHDKDHSFTFTFRKNNVKNRLKEGYWFYGNDWYLAVSFWSGMDWKNKTPNIIFRINKKGDTSLEMTAKDSKKKLIFFEKSVVPQIDDITTLKSKSIKTYKKFKGDYLSSLKSFLKTDKVKIDQIISEALVIEESNKVLENNIGFISSKEFDLRLSKVKAYFRDVVTDQIVGPPISIRSFTIKNFSPIDEIAIDNIPPDANWLFITGLNGAGKTSILKAITAAFFNNKGWSGKLIPRNEFSIQLDLQNQDQLLHYDSNNGNHSLEGVPIACYGAIRQNIIKSKDEIGELTHIPRSLFENDALLLDIQIQLEEWRVNMDSSKVQYPHAEENILQFLEVLPRIIETLVNVDLPYTSRNKNSYTLYTEEDEEGNPLEPVRFGDLASGVRSLVAMFGDMLLRLSAQQPDITDPAELMGIVIIDEIDVHLHPVLQKKVVEVLSDIFQNIQFIATTHSPVPLLGAPINSVFYSVRRSANEGVQIRKIENEHLSKLLPNALLTSPLFDMDSLTPSHIKDKNEMNVDDDYEDDELFKKVDERIEELYKRLES